MADCAGQSPAWKQTPARRLRHRAMMQCARYAYGIAGVMDRDEFDQWQDRMPVALEAEPAPKGPSAYAAKKNGWGEKANEIVHAIASAETIEVLDHLIEANADNMAQMPRQWRDHIQAEYEACANQIMIKRAKAQEAS
jgi:hypothetical protein